MNIKQNIIITSAKREAIDVFAVRVSWGSKKYFNINFVVIFQCQNKNAMVVKIHGSFLLPYDTPIANTSIHKSLCYFMYNHNAFYTLLRFDLQVALCDRVFLANMPIKNRHFPASDKVKANLKIVSDSYINPILHVISFKFG